MSDKNRLSDLFICLREQNCNINRRSGLQLANDKKKVLKAYIGVTQLDPTVG